MMSRRLLVLASAMVSCMVVMALAPAVAFAYELSAGTVAQSNPLFEYALDEQGNATITSCTSTAKYIAIPEALDGHKVVAISSNVKKWGNKNQATSISIPKTVVKIASESNEGEKTVWNPFTNAKKLTKITVKAGNTAFKSKSGVLYSKDGKTLYAYPAGKTAKSYKMPATVRTIGSFALAKSKFTSITVSKNCTKIMDDGFNGCAKLKTLVLPNKVKTIGEYAFNNCKKLTSVTFGKAVTHIGGLCLQGSPKVKQVVIKSTKLTKRNCNAAFSFSRVKKVVINVGKKSLNKKYAKKYSTFFGMDAETYNVVAK